MKQCILYKPLKNNKVQCTACNHYCQISEGQTGICRVRKNMKGKLFSLIYDKIAACHVDPIEKKPLYHFLPNTKTFSIGTLGCNFKCDFCQNFDISQEFKKIKGEKITPKQILDEAIKSNCKSIAYTYNEPTVFIELAHDTAKLAKQKNLKNVWVTNGYMSKQAIEYMTKEKLIDAVNIDLKSFSEDFYEKLCKAKLAPILETIKSLYKKRVHIELTTLIIPNENDSPKEFEKIAKFIASIDKNIPWHISRSFPMYKMINKQSTPIETLKKAEEIGKKYLNYVYLGNV